MTLWLDGRKVRKEIEEDLARKVSDCLVHNQRAPMLAVILIGQDPASQVYVSQKEKALKRVFMLGSTYRLDHDVAQNEVLELIDYLNKDPEVDGILLQLPLPKHLDEEVLINRIDPAKDVDGLTDVNQGLLASEKGLLPCTPKGVIRLLDRYQLPIEGRCAVIVGRSKLVGRPLGQLLLSRNATVIQCHSKTRDLVTYTRQADILISAVGKPNFITADMVKEGAVLIDVGINRTDQGLVGDIDPKAKEKVLYASPVPGGVGPMTVAMLLENVWLCYQGKK